jgi:hypothetical protein
MHVRLHAGLDWSASQTPRDLRAPSAASHAPSCPKDGRASDDRKIVMALSLVAIVILAFHEEIERLA